jgi:hypothetical protein
MVTVADNLLDRGGNLIQAVVTWEDGKAWPTNELGCHDRRQAATTSQWRLTGMRRNTHAYHAEKAIYSYRCAFKF